MCDIGFEKTKDRGRTGNRMQKEPSKGLFKKDLSRNFPKFTTKRSFPKGFLKKMFWEILQNSQQNICAGISFSVFYCEYCEIKNTFFAEQHQTTAIDYSSINSSEGVLANQNVSFDTKTK